jgi:hypothetical protein
VTGTAFISGGGKKTDQNVFFFTLGVCIICHRIFLYRAGLFLKNHGYAIALHFVYYNFVKQHKTSRTTPAMAAGMMKGFMSIEDIVNLVPENKQGKRGSYKKTQTAE